MLTDAQGERIRALILAALTPEAFAPIAAAINEACAENEAAWRAKHDEHAAEPLPPTPPVAVTGEQIATAAREWACDETTAISLGAAVVTKQIAPYAVPYYAQNAFEKKRSLIILDMLFRLGITQPFRDFYAGNVIVKTSREEDTGMAVVDVAMRDKLHIPDLPKAQDEEFKRVLHKAGVGAVATVAAKLMKVLQPMSQPPKGEEKPRHLKSVPVNLDPSPHEHVDPAGLDLSALLPRDPRAEGVELAP